ncbi:MAG: condensation domain-containing protein, partial [Gemmatimonadales bacterium]
MNPAVQVFPTSSAQQRFWVLDQLDPSAAAYTIPLAFKVVGELDPGALQSALNVIVARHESLRTVFALEGEEPVQVVLPELAVEIPLIDLTVRDAAERREAVEVAAARAANQPFDLAHGPLVRASLLRTGVDEHVLLLAFHHTVVDGWSLAILYGELERGYAAFARGAVPDSPPLPLQYPDYAVWQRSMLESTAARRQLAFWKERLSGVLPVLELPTDHPRPATQTASGARRELHLSAALADGMKNLARREGATAYMTFLAAFVVLLRRYSQQDDLIVGSVTAGRNRPELESLIGLF